MSGFRLRESPLPLRILCTGFLCTVGLGFLIVVLEVGATMGGYTPRAVQTGIRGEESPDVVDAFAEEFGNEADPEFSGGLEFGMGYRELVQTTHTHSFAIPLLLLALGGVFLGTDTSDRLKATLYAATFVAVVLDLGGLWLTRYVSAEFAYLNILGGIVLGGCAGIFITRSLWDLWRPGPRASQ